MKICSTFENKKFEKRIAITPESAKKYINLGLEVSLIENYGLHLGYDDNQYKLFGANIVKDEKELINISKPSSVIFFAIRGVMEILFSKFKSSFIEPIFIEKIIFR